MNNLEELSNAEIFEMAKKYILEQLEGINVHQDNLNLLEIEAKSRHESLYRNAYEEALKEYSGEGDNENNGQDEKELKQKPDLTERELRIKKAFDDANLKLARVEGDSMKDAGIESGDLVVYDVDADVEEEDLGIFKFNGNYFVKRLQRKNGILILRSENPNYKDRRIENEEELTKIGRVNFIIKSV